MSQKPLWEQLGYATEEELGESFRAYEQECREAHPDVLQLSDQELWMRLAACPVHGGAWSYKCRACRAAQDEVERRGLVSSKADYGVTCERSY